MFLESVLQLVPLVNLSQRQALITQCLFLVCKGNQIWDFCVTWFICKTQEPDSPLLVCLHTNQINPNLIIILHAQDNTKKQQGNAEKNSRCLSQNWGLKNALQFRITREVQVGNVCDASDFWNLAFLFFKKRRSLRNVVAAILKKHKA